MIWRLAAAGGIIVQADDIFNRIFEDTVHHQVSPESVIMVGGFFVLLAIMVALAFLLAQKPQKLTSDIPSNWILDKDQINKLLDAAVRQRSKIRVSFQHDEKGSRTTDAAMVSADHEEIILEFASIKRDSPEWVGRTMGCEFNMRNPDNPKHMINYFFTAEIHGTNLVSGDILHVSLPYPEHVSITQFRSALRVEPPERYVRAIKIWDAKELRMVEERILTPETWGQPLFYSIRGGRNDLRLENISGGGLRLKITSDALLEHKAMMVPNHQFYCQLNLLDMNQATVSKHYLLCTVVKVFEDRSSRSKITLGMNFAYESRPEIPPKAGLQWKPVNRDWGVVALDNWAFELHLELYRNRLS